MLSFKNVHGDTFLIACVEHKIKSEGVLLMFFRWMYIFNGR